MMAKLRKSPTICSQVLAHLRSLANPDNVAGMARYGISAVGVLGVSMPALRGIARRGTACRARTCRRDHALALELWASDVHEARVLAALVDDPAKVTEAQMESWVRDIDSWDVCDGLMNNLFRKVPSAWAKSREWARRKETFVRRAGFVLMATLAVHDKSAPDAKFLALLPLIRRGATDERNFVKKAVNWALRQIGKRNLALNAAAVAAAREIAALDSRSARWIASDALRELTSPAVLKRLDRKES
jgi:3-methyladenine DNA glycosylase AlkD